MPIPAPIFNLTEMKKKTYKTNVTGKGAKRKRAKKTRTVTATTKKGAARKLGVAESNVKLKKR